MQLNAKGIENQKEWKAKGYGMPSFDHAEMVGKTLKAPVWIHFGAGNIFRGFPAMLMQHLLDIGATEKGIIVGEGFDYEIIDKIYAPHDDISLLVTLKADGTIDKTVVGSVAAAYKCDSSFASEWAVFKKAFASDSLQMVSFTITEKGYGLKVKDGTYMPFIVADMQNGPEGKLSSMMSKVTALVYHRYLKGKKKLALCSMDNCSHNGEKLQTAVMAIAQAWVDAGFCEKGFIGYLQKDVSFPWSMIDKITPRPDDKVKAMLDADGFSDTTVVVTSKNTYIAPFVNAEGPQYLVIEDDFPNGRPALEKSGVYFTDRDTVNKVEKMKVCTCLNPLHTALAIYGCLLGYTLIADEMKDPQLRKMVETIGYKEGMPVVVNPGIIDPKAFIDEVVGKRIPNPFMPDTPQRIATDTSQKISVRFGETIKSYAESSTLHVKDLTYIPLAIAGWFRYLLAVDDNGNPMECSADPMLSELQEKLKGVKPGDPESLGNRIRPVLSNTVIFGSDLNALGLGEKIEQMVKEELAGPGAVRATLKKYLGT